LVHLPYLITTKSMYQVTPSKTINSIRDAVKLLLHKDLKYALTFSQHHTNYSCHEPRADSCIQYTPSHFLTPASKFSSHLMQRSLSDVFLQIPPLIKKSMHFSSLPRTSKYIFGFVEMSLLPLPKKNRQNLHSL